MKKTIILLLCTLMLSGCADAPSSESSTQRSYNSKLSADSSTSSQSDVPNQWDIDMYITELSNKYSQLVSDEEAFYALYYQLDETSDMQELIKAAEKCISTLETLAGVEAPAELYEYQEAVAAATERERRFYENTKSAALYTSGEISLSEEEIEHISTEMNEYYSIEGSPLSDAFLAAINAATS